MRRRGGSGTTHPQGVLLVLPNCWMHTMLQSASSPQQVLMEQQTCA